MRKGVYTFLVPDKYGNGYELDLLFCTGSVIIGKGSVLVNRPMATAFTRAIADMKNINAVYDGSLVTKLTGITSRKDMIYAIDKIEKACDRIDANIYAFSGDKMFYSSDDAILIRTEEEQMEQPFNIKACNRAATECLVRSEVAKIRR